MTSNSASPRLNRLLDGTTREQLLLEIAPYHSPLVAKRDGYNVRTLDVFSRDELLELMEEDPNILSKTELEEVDFVGSATEIASLVPEELHGAFDAILSSHNFEHLPNPIKFLAGCEAILKPDGRLIMAVPDARVTFDVFKPLTAVDEWLEAFIGDHWRPTPRQVFSNHAMKAYMRQAGHDVPHSSFSVETDAYVLGDIGNLFDEWKAELPGSEYRDAHCTIMVPDSFELLLLETKALGLIKLELESLEMLPGKGEFMIRLRRQTTPQAVPSTDEVNQRRTQLYRALAREQSMAHPNVAKRFATAILGKRAVRAAQQWNRERRRKRR